MAIDLTAYIVSATDGWTITPAGATRDWMDLTPQKFAYRCLPLAMANQAGWVLGCPLSFSVTWNGQAGLDALKFSFNPEDLGPNKGQITSHFGSGILTFSLPYLFRTSPGYGMLVRGPTNCAKDGAAPLDGIVETDWAPYSFTMNWKITRRREPIWFRKGEPICMICPFPMAMLEDVRPRVAPITEDKTLFKQYAAFVSSRSAGLADLFGKGTPFWEKAYMKGVRPDGSEPPEHRSRFALPGFEPGAVRAGAPTPPATGGSGGSGGSGGGCPVTGHGPKPE